MTKVNCDKCGRLMVGTMIKDYELLPPIIGNKIYDCPHCDIRIIHAYVPKKAEEIRKLIYANIIQYCKSKEIDYLGDDFSDGYNMALDDLLQILEGDEDEK